MSKRYKQVINDGLRFTDEAMAKLLNVTPEKFREAIEELKMAGLVKENGDGVNKFYTVYTPLQIKGRNIHER